MNYKGIDLRTATIHDFTSDPKILVDEFGIEENKEEYSSHIPIETRVRDLMDYADLTKNKELESAIEKTFEKELETFSFE